MKILIACEYSAIVRDAFRAKGHDAWSCDILPTDGDPQWHIQGDVLEILNDGWDMMIAHPPCTYLTCTGNRWFKSEYKERFPDREEKREEAISFVLALWSSPIKRRCIENPVGVLSTRFKKPTQIIQPYEYGHPDRKRTCLWLDGLLPLRPTKIVAPNIKTNRNGKTVSVHHDEALRLPPIERAKVRSLTYSGWAKAMADQWG